MHNIVKLIGLNEVVLKGNFIPLNTLIKRLERCHTSNLIAHLNALKEKKQTYPREVNGRK